MLQLCQIVDQNDQIIGLKPRDKIDFKKDYYRVSCLWLKNSKGEVLLAKRLATKDKDPGKWGPAVSGTLEKGETYDSNINKEAIEEIGLDRVKFSPLKKLKIEQPRKYFIQLYIGICDWPANKFTPQPEEVEQVAWITIEDLFNDIQKNPDKYVPSIKILLEAAEG